MSSCMYKGTDRKHCPKNPCNQTGPYEADEEDCALLLCSKHRIVMREQTPWNVPLPSHVHLWLS